MSQTETVINKFIHIFFLQFNHLSQEFINDFFLKPCLTKLNVVPFHS